MIIKLRIDGKWKEIETDRVGILTDDRGAIAGVIQQKGPGDRDAYLAAMAGEEDLASVMQMLDEGIPQKVISIGVK